LILRPVYFLGSGEKKFAEWKLSRK